MAIQQVTYLGNPELKRAFLAEIAKHEEQDRFIKGTYGQMNGVFKGCAVGCSLHSLNLLQGKVGKGHEDQRVDDHGRYEAELGIHTWLAFLEDNIFESLPNDEAETWPRRFADAIPVGVQISDLVLAKILWWCLMDPTLGVAKAVDDIPEVEEVVKQMGDLFARVIAGEQVSDAEFDAAARAARAARAAWAARAAFYPALSREVLRLLAELQPEVVNG